MKIIGIVVVIGIIGLVISGVLILLNPFGIVLWSDTVTTEEKIVWTTEPDTGIPMSNISRADESEVYILPIGGFDESDIDAATKLSADLNYTFYTRSWGPGEVTYKIDIPDNCKEVLSNGSLVVSVQPSIFTAEPYHNYTSHVHIETSPTFETTINNCGYQGQMHIRMNVTFENTSVNLGNDTLNIITSDGQSPGYSSTRGSDSFSIEQQNIFSLKDKKIDLNPGETAQINWSFYRGERAFGEVSYMVSATPLNVTIEPVQFLANRAVREYQGVILIHANNSLVSGLYPVYIRIKGQQSTLSDSTVLFIVNVTAMEPVDHGS